MKAILLKRYNALAKVALVIITPQVYKSGGQADLITGFFRQNGAMVFRVLDLNHSMQVARLSVQSSLSV